MQNSDTPTDVKPNKGKWTLIALFGVSILPIAAAYTMFFTGVGVPDNTVNAGTLLPQAVNVNTLFDNKSEFLQQINSQKKWRLFIPITENCSQACEKNLYTTRQVHVRLSEKSVRVERIAVNIGANAGEQFFNTIKTEHPNLALVTVDNIQWQTWLDESGQALDENKEHYYLLVDQEGFAMMFYTEQQHGNDLLKDIKRALKYSIDYQ